MHHVASDLGSLILILVTQKECTLRFLQVIFFNLPPLTELIGRSLIDTVYGIHILFISTIVHLKICCDGLFLFCNTNTTIKQPCCFFINLASHNYGSFATIKKVCLPLYLFASIDAHINTNQSASHNKDEKMKKVEIHSFVIKQAFKRLSSRCRGMSACLFWYRQS